MAKRIVVLGGGESGYGSAVLAKVKGFDVFLSDFGKIPEKYKEKLAECGIPFEEGGHTESLIMNADEVIKSPGIPDKAPMVKALRERNIPVISEIEFAGRYNTAKTICITGSNGKTTTTTLIYEILKKAGINVGLAGNIGQSFAYQIATADFDWYVIELSSFQLDGMFDFCADIAVLMNITPDHLDRYDNNMQNYINSKFRIIRNQKAEHAFIYCADDPATTENLQKQDVFAQALPFGVKNKVDGIIRCDIDDISLELSVSELKIKGIHNSYNAMAAIMAAMKAGVEVDKIKEALREFTGIEHRLEFVCEKDGVQYINDSKATNVDSVWYALESMTRPVIWIAGGTDKGNVYAPLFDLAKEKVKVLVCMGLDNSKLIESFKDIVLEIIDTCSLDTALAAAKKSAESGDVVLLSPACASFDLFKNYEDRGEQFKKKIKEI